MKLPGTDNGDFIICGIVGVAGKITIKEERVLRTLLILDTLRGIDSTGVAVVPRIGNVKVTKELGNAYSLLDTKSYDKVMMGAHRAIIGHNRFATQGIVSKRNAHPFDFDGIVGVHNGTLKNKYKLLDSKDFDVDSENLYHHINQKGLRDAMNVISGAWALVWWDKFEESINFLRNEERPLYLTRSVDGGTLFWASELWMLQVACSREDINIEQPVILQTDMHHSIRIDDTGKMDKVVVTPMEAKKLPEITNHPFYQNGTYGNHPKRNVLQLPNKDSSKNNGVVPETTFKVKHLKVGYENSKNASLEVKGYGTDSFGATYYICEDIENINLDVRLYYNSRGNSKENVGTKITCDIGELKISVKDGSYYKVVASSVKVIEYKPAKHTYRTSRGGDVDYNTWMGIHGTCDCCGGNVFPSEQYKFTKDHGIICESCAEDKELVSMFC